MNEATGYIILAVLGFLIGGIYGHFWDSGFFPDAWYGLCVGIGGPIIVHVGDCH